MRDVKLEEVASRSDGATLVKLMKRFVDDATGEVMFSEPHRFVIEAGDELYARIADVDAYLAIMNYPPIAEADVAAIATARNVFDQ